MMIDVSVKISFLSALRLMLFFFSFSNVQGLEGTRILLTCQSFESQARASLCVHWLFYSSNDFEMYQASWQSLGHISQCIEQPEKLALCGLDSHELHRSDRLQDNNKSHLVNVLKVFDAFWPLNCSLPLDAWLHSYWVPFGHISVSVFSLEERFLLHILLHKVIGEISNLKAGNMYFPSMLFIYICLEIWIFMIFFTLFPSSMDYPQTQLSSFSVLHVTFCLFVFFQAGVVYSNKVIIMSSMQTKGQVIHATSHGLEPTLSIHKYVPLQHFTITTSMNFWFFGKFFLW